MISGAYTPVQSNLQESTANHINQSEIKKQTYLLKILQAQQLNKNLKQLHNNLVKKLHDVNRNSQEVIISQKEKFLATGSRKNIELINMNDQKNLDKKCKKMETEVQHMTHLLNILISSNNKLKDQVNNYRNSRVIYSNVYKNLEKQIRKYEDQYKIQIVQNLALEDAFQKLKEKLKKITLKYQKEYIDMKNENIKMRDTNQANYDLMRKSQKHGEKTGQGTTNNISLKNIQDSTFQLGSGGSSFNTTNNKIGEQQNKQKTKQSAIKSLMKKSKTKLITNNQQTQLYQAQQKRLYLQNIVKNLKSMTGMDNLNEIIQYLLSIQKENEEIFNQYHQLQQKVKMQQLKLKNLQGQIQILKQKNDHQQSSTVTPSTNFNDQQIQLLDLTEQLQRQQQQLKQLQAKITQKIDMNCKNMSEEDIQYQFNRKFNNNRNRENAGTTGMGKNLQKILQRTQKKKNQDSYIMTFQQMHKNNLKLLQ